MQIAPHLYSLRGEENYLQKHKILFYPELCGEKNEIDMTTVTARFDIKKKDELLFYSKKKMGWGLNVGMKRK